MNPVHLALSLMAFNGCMAALDAVFVRLVSDHVPLLEIAFFRNLFSLVALMLILPYSEWKLGTSKLWPIHVLRAVIKLLALVAYFTAITMLPIALVTSIAFTMPLFVMLGSVLFLGEPLRTHRVLAIAAGLGGMAIILRPSGVDVGVGMVLALGSALGLAAVALLMKVSSGREEPLRIVWFNLVVTVPVALLLAIPVWQWPDWQTLGLMAMQGGGGLLAQLSFARAMRLADASILISMDFIRLPVAVILALLLFDEPVDLRVLAGGAVIFGGVLMSGWWEGRRDRP